MTRSARLAIGIALTIVLAWLYHGPFGTGERLAQRAERSATAELVRLEMGSVAARFERHPLRRTLLLSGPADDFQRGELVRIMGAMPGVGAVRWVAPAEAGGGWRLPLLAEVELLALTAFGFGLLLAWLAEWRRRSRREY